MPPDGIRVGVEYEAARDGALQALAERKRARRIQLGAGLCMVWESRESVTIALEEALRADRVSGGAEAQSELEAFRPLVPDQGELLGLLYLDAADPAERGALAAELAGIERTVTLEIAGEAIPAEPALEPEEVRPEVQRGTEASAGVVPEPTGVGAQLVRSPEARVGDALPGVHALRFLPGDQRRRALAGGAEVTLVVDHPRRRVRVPLDEAQRAALADLLEEPPAAATSR